MNDAVIEIARAAAAFPSKPYGGGSVTCAFDMQSC